MAAARSPEAAEAAIARYNRKAAEVERLEDRLYEARWQRSRLHDLAFQALPDGYAIHMGDRFELRPPS